MTARFSGAGEGDHRRVLTLTLHSVRVRLRARLRRRPGRARIWREAAALLHRQSGEAERAGMPIEAAVLLDCAEWIEDRRLTRRRFARNAGAPGVMAR